MIPVIRCGCGGEVFAVEQGLVCKACNAITYEVPIFITNWAWNRFMLKEEREEAELYGEP